MRLAPLALALLTLGSGCTVADGSQDESTGVEGDDAYEAESIDSMREVLIFAHDAGVACANLPMAGAIARAESGLNTKATGYNGATSGCPGGSVDRGLWQINSCYHPDVSVSCAFDGACNARAMVKISSKGTNWKPWSTYNNGAYKSYLATAKAAYNSGIPGCTSGSGGGGGGSSSGCYSGTLGKTVAEGACVESKYDSAWYTCESGSWAAGKSSCTSTYPLGGSSGKPCYSNTLKKTMPEHTCVESKYDSAWYTCIDGVWKYGKAMSGSCSASYPL